eukprot:5056600-Amphidinium_carterae.1
MLTFVHGWGSPKPSVCASTYILQATKTIDNIGTNAVGRAATVMVFVAIDVLKSPESSSEFREMESIKCVRSATKVRIITAQSVMDTGRKCRP